MNHLDQLEARSIYILREAYASFRNLSMLWSIGKDSTVLLWLARRAFFGHVPFPLLHIDTSYEIPELIRYRDQLARDWKLNLIVGQHDEALQQGRTFPNQQLDRLNCCRLLRVEALKRTLNGSGIRYRLNHQNGHYEPDSNREPYDGVIAGIRSDEEGSRSKERYFSPRDQQNSWDISEQPPEFWNQFKSDFAPGTHVRVHPLLDWTELNIWEYIEREQIPLVSLYFNQGEGRRYRSLGCYPCTSAIDSEAATVSEVIAELSSGQLRNVPERAGRATDKEDEGGLETLRREGHM